MAKQPTWLKDRAATAGDAKSRFRLVSIDDLHAAMLARDIRSGYKLSQVSGVKVSTVNHLVHGRRKTASAETISGLREALGANVDKIFVLEESQVSGDLRMV